MAPKSSTAVVRVETDCGEGYLKALGNPAGPHALACELVGTQLARWFKLPTFDFALIEVTPEDEIPFYNGGVAASGPAFITRFEAGLQWGGGRQQLEKISNREDIGRMVVFDTWTRNCDRQAPPDAKREPHRDNVYLSRKGATGGKFILKAIDHTHCFTCGRELSPRLAQIAAVQDTGLYGMFTEFRPLIERADVAQAVADLRALKQIEVEAMVATVPTEWQVNDSARRSWVELICRRAEYVTDNVVRLIWPQGELNV
jgi:hypothetical protein